LKTADVWSFPCKCGKVYIDEIGCSIENRIKVHHRSIRLYHPAKLPVTEYSTDLDYCIQYQDSMFLAMKTGCMECIIIREAMEIALSW
jgi:hypothetical protein